MEGQENNTPGSRNGLVGAKLCKTSRQYQLDEHSPRGKEPPEAGGGKHLINPKRPPTSGLLGKENSGGKDKVRRREVLERGAGI